MLASDLGNFSACHNPVKRYWRATQSVYIRLRANISTIVAGMSASLGLPRSIKAQRPDWRDDRELADFFDYSLHEDIEREWERCHRDFDDVIAEIEEELDVKDHPKETP